MYPGLGENTTSNGASVTGGIADSSLSTPAAEPEKKRKRSQVRQSYKVVKSEIQQTNSPRNSSLRRARW